MIESIKTYRSDTYHAYQNQGVELYFLERVQPGELYFYLWQNKDTVFIGRNQDCARECKYELLEAEGGKLARRLSGGGAVYHEVANLNFTFVVRAADYDVQRQSQVIVRALAKLGLHAEMSGRNDLTIDGAKFSGNAYYRQGDARFQHGTILMNVNTENMARYLKPSKKKLASKGVKSVRSRVVNLNQLLPDLTIDELSDALVAAVEEEYGCTAQALTKADFDQEAYAKAVAFFEDPAWRYGVNLKKDHSLEDRFDWGEVQLAFTVKDEEFTDVTLFTDANDPSIAAPVEQALLGIPARKQDARAALIELATTSPEHATMIGDIATLIDTSDLPA